MLEGKGTYTLDISSVMYSTHFHLRYRAPNVSKLPQKCCGHLNLRNSFVDSLGRRDGRTGGRGDGGEVRESERRRGKRKGRGK